MATLTAEKMRLLGKLRNVNGYEKIARQQQQKTNFQYRFHQHFHRGLKERNLH